MRESTAIRTIRIRCVFCSVLKQGAQAGHVSLGARVTCYGQRQPASITPRLCFGTSAQEKFDNLRIALGNSPVQCTLQLQSVLQLEARRDVYPA